MNINNLNILYKKKHDILKKTFFDIKKQKCQNNRNEIENKYLKKSKYITIQLYILFIFILIIILKYLKKYNY